MAFDLDRWWRVMRLHLEPATEAPVLAPAALEEALRERFAERSPAMADRLALPPLFARYLEILGPRAWRGEDIDLDFMLFDAKGVLMRVERIAANGDRTGTTYVARELAALPPASGRVLVIDAALALAIEITGSRTIYDEDDLQMALLEPEAIAEVIAELERRGFPGSRVLAWHEPRHQLWPGSLVEVTAFLRRAAGERRTVLVVAAGWAPYEPDPDPARALVERLKRPGPVPTGDPDPFACAWALGRDLPAMIELLQIAARRGIYELDVLEMTSSSYDTRWRFHVRVPGGNDTLVDVTRELGAPALRAIVPAIATQETWTAATLAMHDAFVDTARASREAVPVDEVVEGEEARGGLTRHR